MPAYLDLQDLLPALHSFYQADNLAWRPNAQPSISTLRLVVREKFPHLVTPLGNRARVVYVIVVFRIRLGIMFNLCRAAQVKTATVSDRC
jgi:hypothetical protein